MKQPANLRVRRRVIVLIVAAWISAAVWTPGIASAAGEPQAPGTVIKSWVPPGLIYTPFGVGYTGQLWISEPITNKNYEFTVGGTAGRAWLAGWTGSGWIADMTYLPGRNLLCQVTVGGDRGIYCWDPGTGAVTDKIVGTLPWTSTTQRGLAYRADDDTFYIGGWNQGIIYRIKGLSYSDKGAVVRQCTPADPNNVGGNLGISGLAYNAAFKVLWVATNSATDTVYALNADFTDTCAIVPTAGLNGTLPHPDPESNGGAGRNGGGLEMDENGNLWMVSQGAATVYLIASGLPASTPPPSPQPVTSILDVVKGVPDTAFRNPELRGALVARINNILRSIEAGNIVPARQMIRALRMRVDGCGTAADGDDWIVNCTHQKAVRDALGALVN